MKQEQTSLEKAEEGVTLKELLFCYNTIQNKKGGATTQEEYDMLVKTESETKWILLDNHKKVLADQKAKYMEWFNTTKEFNEVRDTKKFKRVLKEFEELM